MKNQVLIEGYTENELLSFPDAQLDAYTFTSEPIILKIGSAEILGRFDRTEDCLQMELAHIDGGGEGVLPCLLSFTQRLAKKRGYTQIAWYVHAVNCAKPNSRLKVLLIRKGYTLKDVAGIGEVYFKRDSVAA